MSTDIINDNIFNIINSVDRQNILSLLIKNSLFKQEQNDLYWLEVTEALSRLAIYKACSLGFLSLDLDAPINSPITIFEKQIQVAHANDIGLSIINDLENFHSNNEEKFEALIISCPNLSAIFLLSKKLQHILQKVSSGNLIITFNVNARHDAKEITIQDESLCFSEIMIRKALHEIGFKRIRRNDDFDHTESWKHESKLFVFKDEFFNSIFSRTEESDGFYVKTYVCDLGLNNVN